MSFRTRFANFFTIVILVALLLGTTVPMFAGTGEANQPIPLLTIHKASMAASANTWVRIYSSFCFDFNGGVPMEGFPTEIVDGNLANVSTSPGEEITTCLTPFQPPSGEFGGPPAWAWAVWRLPG
jgi:hypothetical protein